MTDRLQWAGEEYILDELNDEVKGLKKAGITLFYSISGGNELFIVTVQNGGKTGEEMRVKLACKHFSSLIFT